MPTQEVPNPRRDLDLNNSVRAILCSVYDEVHKVTCDLPLKHGGAHKAAVLWGDEESGRDDD